MAFHEAGIPLSHGKHTITYYCCCFTGIKTQHRALTTKPFSDNENKTAFPYHTVGARFAPPHNTPTNIPVRTVSLTHSPSTDPNQLSQITYTCPFTPALYADVLLCGCRSACMAQLACPPTLPPNPVKIVRKRHCANTTSPELTNLVQLALFAPSPKPRQNCAQTSYR